MGIVKKNIIILDCSDKEVFKTFIHSKHFHVVACIVFSLEQKQYCLEHNIQAITLQEADFLDGIDYIDFELINSFRDTQRKVEFGMMRSLESNMLIANKYYNALGYFYHLFQNHTVDCVFVHGVPHGYIPETILLDMATKRKIPAYCTFPITSSYSSILRYDKKYNLKVTSPINNQEVLAHLFDKSKPSFKQEIFKTRLNSQIKYLVHKGGGANGIRPSLLYQTEKFKNSYGIL